MKNKLSTLGDFQKIIDLSPMGASLWRAGEDYENWKKWTFVYGNNRIKNFLGLDMSYFVGMKAGDLPEGFDKENFDRLFKQVVESQEAQSATLNFGSDFIPYARMQIYLVPLNEEYMANFYDDVTLQVESKEALSGKIADLEELSRYMVSREVKIAAFKMEVSNLEKKLSQLEPK